MALGDQYFTCDACGKRYPWKPELAGRKARCKCGQVMVVPAEAAAAEQNLYDLAEDAPPKAPARAPTPASQVVDDAYRCSGCGATLVPGTVVCTTCGMNLKTGQYAGAERAPSLPAAAPVGVAAPAVAKPGRVLGYARPGRAADSPERQRAIRQIVTVSIIGVLVIGVVVGARFLLRSTNRPPPPPLPGDDARAMEKLRDEYPIEAREYLSVESRILGSAWTRQQALGRIDSWYEMGAKKVWAFTSIMCITVVIELPDEPAKREKLFAWYTRWEEEHFRQPKKDVGQKYLVVGV